jgi:hypothetical protein
MLTIEVGTGAADDEQQQRRQGGIGFGHGVSDRPGMA